ncbi:hypothetical protein BI292_13410 [Pseudomonas sp. 43NM1]|uniref:DUF3606 domain-containing protein n=1 Tax=Pseudomonas sp. 43NM1 TaxID=1904755 RepID=UPI000C32722C|nr:DUF3606 domain-containing protein [Pseudomonas sp. 43NM1]PKH24158.1 hypothetical protein BI292_13410 [Pseudomonas sp. 43NM1]
MEKQNPLVANDALRINIQDGTELKFSAARLGVSKKEIKAAVEQVGDSLTAVTRHLVQVRRS